MARSRRRTLDTAKPEAPSGEAPVRAPADDTPFEQDTVRDLGPDPGHRGLSGRTRGLAMSLPGAIVGTLLVTALAFGVGGWSPAGDREPATRGPVPDATLGAGPDALATAGDDRGGDVADWTPAADVPAAADGSAPPDGDEAPDAGSPADETPSPTLAPPRRLELGARVRTDGKVVLDWSGCDPTGFAAYRLVRSTDETVTWPKGANDTLVATIEDPAKSASTDAKAPAGRRLWYRVFALVRVDGTLVVGCLSNAARVTTPKPPEPTPKPTTAPAALTLKATLREGHPWLDWSGCASDRFDAYKVVRSRDATVTWPLGENDVLVAAIGNPAESAFWDKDAPAGRTLSYRVFCVDRTESGYVVLAASGVASVTTPAAEPPPDPVTLGFEAKPVAGGVLLDWTSFAGDGFVYYKVVRSTSPNPSYLPWTDGTQLIGVIESASNSAFEDGTVEPGQTWYYRVQAIGTWNGQKVVLAQTAAVEVSVP